MPVDWSATGTLWSGAGTLLGAAAVIYAAKKGASTFKQWKEQNLEERKTLVAEQALTLAYKLGPAISHIRQPYLSAEESAGARDVLTDRGLIDAATAEHRISSLTTAQATLNRINSNRELFNQLSEIRPSVRVLFGQPIESHLAEYESVARKVQAAAIAYGQYRERAFRTQEEAHREWARAEANQNVLWEGANIGDDGETVDPLKDAITEAETQLERALQGHFNLNPIAENTRRRWWQRRSSS